MMNLEEVTIPVPWGHVAAKLWGDSRNPHVLVLHGVQDNAGSFDRLILHLPNYYYYICFDLPGHGKSSHFPPFLPVHIEDYMVFYKLMVKHFSKERYLVMGHSFGGHLSCLFARLYPQYIEKLILLDNLHAFPVPVDEFHSYLRERFDFIVDLNEKMATRKPPLYTYEEALNKVTNERRYGYLTEESGRVILQRALIPTEDGKYSFSTDPRMKLFMNPSQDFRYITDCLKKCPFTFPVLIILGTDSVYQLTLMKPIIKVYENNKFVQFKYVPGNHDVHMNDPELIGKYVSKFLRNTDSKL